GAGRHAGGADGGILLPELRGSRRTPLLYLSHGLSDGHAGLAGLVCQCAAVGREPDGAVRQPDQRLQLAGVFAGPDDLHPLVRGRRGAAVLGAGGLLWLAVPLWRVAGTDQPDRTQAAHPAMDPAMG